MCSVPYVIKLGGSTVPQSSVGFEDAAGVFYDRESVSHSLSETGGAKVLSFVLRRDITFPWPDLRAGTEVVAEVYGVPVWTGRIKAAPRERDGLDSITVECEGLFDTLGDELTERAFAFNNMSAWIDTRTSPAVVNNAYWPATYQVDLSDEGAKLSTQISVAHPAGTSGGITLDLGPFNTAKRIVVVWESSNSTNAVTLYARTHAADPRPGGGSTPYSDAFAYPLDTGAANVSAGNFATPGRFVTLFLYWAAGGAPTLDHWVRIKSVTVFTETDYSVSTASALRTDHILKYMLTNHCPAISADHSLIQNGSVILASYPPSIEFRSAAEMWQDISLFDGNQFMIAPDGRPVYRPRPTTPQWVVTMNSAPVSDGGADDIADLYNKAIVNYTDADTGAPGVALVDAPATSYLSLQGITRTAVVSLGAAANAAAASAVGATLLRDAASPRFAGSIAVAGSIEEYGTGAHYPVALIQAGDMVLISNMIDPVTGSPGRQVIITEVSYSLASNTATLTLDGGNKYLDRLQFLLDNA